ncbi:hypothetical protein ACFQE8_15490 [Salinirubellus sp. GCM10025818]|uniref:hypothetical protein n=1 Tax=Salinirubellus TaxID=2162630 RepID=UPI0030CCD805
MDQPTPAEGWPDGPLTEEEVRDLLGGTDHTDDPVRAVWVFDGGGEGAREAILGDDGPEDVAEGTSASNGRPVDADDAVIDLVLETTDEYRMFSYTYGRTGLGWQDYGSEPAESETMADTLESYRLLVGETELKG